MAWQDSPRFFFSLFHFPVLRCSTEYPPAEGLPRDTQLRQRWPLEVVGSDAARDGGSRLRLQVSESGKGRREKSWFLGVGAQMRAGVDTADVDAAGEFVCEWATIPFY